MTVRLDGKVAVVTGAGSGLGRAAALTLAREGAKVVVSDISADGGEETVSLIREHNGEALFVKTNVTDAADVKALMSKAFSAYGSIDCAVNNAGIQGDLATVAACTEENWDRVIAVNLKGVWLCMKYEIPYMREQGGGSIVNMASIAGLRSGLQRYAAYAASKHGVVGLTSVAAVEYAKRNIRINAVCPGFIQTPFVEAESISQVEAWMNVRIPMARFGTPQEIAEAVVWLCSDAASFMTGHAMVLDGGLLA